MKDIKVVKIAYTIVVPELNDTVIVEWNAGNPRNWWTVVLVWTEMSFCYDPPDKGCTALDVLDYIISTYSADILIQQINRKLI